MIDQPVAVVTGGSRGIGKAIALQAAADGHAVIVNYRSNEAAAGEVVDEVTARGGRAEAVAADIGSPDDRAELVDRTLQRWGRIDLLVNNAGITSQGRRDVLEATEASWDAVFDTNLKGPFFLAQRIAREMLTRPPGDAGRRGTIVNISSISAYAATTNRADYCIAKAGMQMMTWLLADRLAEAGVGVFEICPGVIASDMTAPVKQKYDELIADGLTPIRRWGRPEDVARAVSTIVSGGLPFSTGQRIHVDGGFHIRRLG